VPLHTGDNFRRIKTARHRFSRQQK